MHRILFVAALASASCGSGDSKPTPFSAAACPDAELGCPRPIFGVASLTSSLAFYRDKLGFKIDWEYGEPADFASVSRSDLTIFLGQTVGAGHGALWVATKDVDKLHAEFKKRGIIAEQPPKNMPWGSREMHVRDLDRNLIRFAGPTR